MKTEQNGTSDEWLLVMGAIFAGVLLAEIIHVIKVTIFKLIAMNGMTTTATIKYVGETSCRFCNDEGFSQMIDYINANLLTSMEMWYLQMKCMLDQDVSIKSKIPLE